MILTRVRLGAVFERMKEREPETASTDIFKGCGCEEEPRSEGEAGRGNFLEKTGSGFCEEEETTAYLILLCIMCTSLPKFVRE